MAKRSVSVRVRGHELRLRSDDDEESLQRIAAYLDQTMARVESRTNMVDSHSVALLTALNLAREVIDLRAGQELPAADPARMRRLIELAESALDPRPSA